nr:lipase family protein [Myxococcota bacterium]
REDGARYTPALLRGLASAAGVVLPRDPEHAVSTEVIAYVTQDRGALVQSTAVLAYPTDLETREELPIVLVLHGTSGFRASCGPTADSSAQALAAVFASYGWIAVAPDYLGLESAGAPYGALHPYLVAEATAIASLDAVRAAARTVASDRGALCASTRVAVFGGSQGGHATLWVDRLAPYYARELAVMGGVATVPTADVVGQAERALGALVPATANFAAMIATQAPWYGANDRLAEIFVAPLDVDVPAALAASCSPGDAIEPTSLDALYTSTFLEAVARDGVAAIEPIGCWLRESSLTETSIPRIDPSEPSHGILFVVGEDDTLIHPPIERAAYDTLCAAGVRLEYLECAGAGHVPATLWAIPEVLDFLDARRAGDAFTPQCTRPAASRCRGTPEGE